MPNLMKTVKDIVEKSWLPFCGHGVYSSSQHPTYSLPLFYTCRYLSPICRWHVVDICRRQISPIVIFVCHLQSKHTEQPSTMVAQAEIFWGYRALYRVLEYSMKPEVDNK